MNNFSFEGNRKFVAAYRRFADDYSNKQIDFAVRAIKYYDSNHLITFKD